jgi:hypothetical protein
MSAIETMGTGEQTGSRIAYLVAALIIRESILHRLFGRKTLCIGLAEIVAALGTGFCVIFPSLMIGIDQIVVSERRNTFCELINGVLLCGSEHFASLSPAIMSLKFVDFEVQSGSRPY